MTSSEIQIDKNVPLPGRGGRYGHPSKWSAFAVGDSTFFPGERFAKKLVNAAQAWGRSVTPSRKFSGRFVTEDGATGTRIWRVE